MPCSATLVPYVLLYICGENHLRAVWRLSFGLGCVFPIVLLFFRTKMVESTRFVKASMVRGPMPYKLIFKRYWKSFLGLSIAWFLYDFIAYPFGIYSSTIVDIITGGATDLKTVFKWNIVINAFYASQPNLSRPTIFEPALTFTFPYPRSSPAPSVARSSSTGSSPSA